MAALLLTLMGRSGLTSIAGSAPCPRLWRPFRSGFPLIALGVLGSSQFTPQNVRVDGAGETWLSLSWLPGADNGDCNASSWHVEWRAHGSQAWSPPVEDCLSNTFCNISGLEANSPYDVRVRETCNETLSGYASPSYSLWTLPGTWEITLAPSLLQTVTLELVHPPLHCAVLKDCCGDQFSLCHTGDLGKTVAVTRTDVPGGWGSTLRMSCTALAVSDFVAAREEQPAATPELMELKDPTLTTLGVKIRMGYAFGTTSTCQCGYSHVQLKSHISSEWFTVTGECAVLGVRECTATDLHPDVEYQGRVRLGCANEAASSDWTYAAASAISPPGCAWTTHTGAEEYECYDGSLCPTVNETCCNERGGRLRCPRSEPIMCQGERDCAESQDRCCRESEAACSDHGGVRPCEVPAKPPALVSVTSERAFMSSIL